MTQNNRNSENPVLEVKGSVLTIITLHIRDVRPDVLYPHLVKKFGQARAFFKNAPVIVDLGDVDESSQLELDFIQLVSALKEFGMVPVGVRGGSGSVAEKAVDAGLGVLPAIKTKHRRESVEDAPAVPEQSDNTEPTATATEEPPPETSEEAGTSHTVVPTKVVSQPVRGGQQVFAPEGDLIVLSSVNPGAEVIAAGNIHVYGALRGRAIAGINGDSTARIFSLQANPELVAIAGEYMVNEYIDQDVLNQSAIFTLNNGSLDVQVVGSFKPVV